MRHEGRARSGPGRGAAGMTLVELLMVMALIGLLLGAGVGMLSSLDLERRALVGRCQNVLRAARNSAVARAGSAQVLIDSEAGTLTARASEVVGTWHFEDRLTGARDATGASTGTTFTDAGFIGAGLAVGGGAFAEFPVQLDPSWDFEHGFTLECAVRFDEPGRVALVDVGGAFGLTQSGDLGVRGWFVPRVASEAGPDRAGGLVAVDLEPGTLRQGSWHRLRLEYDRRVLRLSVDGLPLARSEHVVPVWNLAGPLRLGAERDSGAASLDGLVVGAVAVSETVVLPEGVAFSEAAPALLRFGPTGHLDRGLHPQAVEFGLDFDDGARVPLRVNVYGTVE